MRADLSLKIPARSAELKDYALQLQAAFGPGGTLYPTYGLFAPPVQLDAFTAALVAAFVANEKTGRNSVTATRWTIAKQEWLDYVRPIRQQIANFPEPDPPLGLVTALGVAGTFSSTPNTLEVGDFVTVSGLPGPPGVGSISGGAGAYVPPGPQTYYVSVVTDSTHFELQYPPQVPMAIVTVAGVISQLEFQPGAYGELSRPLKVRLRINPHFTNKGIAGSNVLNRTPIAVTKAAPEFSMLPVGTLQIQFRYHYDGVTSKRGKYLSSQKPIGASELQFFYKLTRPSEGGDPHAGFVPMLIATRSPFTWQAPASLGGKNIWVACRYISAKGEAGVMSGVQSCIVPLVGGTGQTTIS
jgi:hypothetical protein